MHIRSYRHKILSYDLAALPEKIGFWLPTSHPSPQPPTTKHEHVRCGGYGWKVSGEDFFQRRTKG